MPLQKYTLRELAQYVDIDIEEALLRIWDAGISSVNNPDGKIRYYNLKCTKLLLSFQLDRK